MKCTRFFLMVGMASLVAFASCDKPEIIDPTDKPDVEIPDTTETGDSIKPEQVIPEDAFFVNSKFSGGNSPQTGWRTSWNEGDEINVFSIAKECSTKEELWANHGKYTYASGTENSLFGEMNERLFGNETYVWHAVYPYSEEFTDPAGIENDSTGEEQALTVVHLPGEYIVQNGYDNADHLTGPTIPLYGAATVKGSETPVFTMHQMLGVIKVKAMNTTSSPITITDVKVGHSLTDLVGRFAVDFSEVTRFGHAGSDLERISLNASKEVSLKVEGATEIPVGEAAEFYLPIMPNSFGKGTRFTITLNDYLHVEELPASINIAGGGMRTFNITLQDPLDVKLVSPSAESAIDLDEVDRVEFKWEPLDQYEDYLVLLSASEDMANFIEFEATGSSTSMNSQIFDNSIFSLGLEAGETKKIYWTVVVDGDYRPAYVNALTVSRKDKLSPEKRAAEPLTIPVAILVEDPIYYGRMTQHYGKRISQITHKGWGYRWNDPYVQMKEFERDMEASSHGVVQYEVVKVVECDQLFSYHRNSYGNNYNYMTVDTLVNYYFNYRPTSGNNTVDNAAHYDYLGMMKHYGFDKMVDNGEIKEVWVYTHPTSGMNESRLIGEGAFWCNSTGIGTNDGATNTELCCVMFCNYERTTDLAMHSYAHRVESIMAQVYERRGGLYGWNYATKNNVNELTNWEKFSAYGKEYSKYKEGYSHIGMCHFPPNATHDYDYGNSTYIKTYADTWADYPDIREDESVARTVNRTEWADAGGDQWGYMKWYFGHLPYFKGICPRDGHLNNWWHYIVDYFDALEYESELNK